MSCKLRWEKFGGASYLAVTTAAIAYRGDAATAAVATGVAATAAIGTAAAAEEVAAAAAAEGAAQ